MKNRLLAILLALAGLAASSAHALLDDVSWSATRIVRLDGREFVTRVNHVRGRERISALLGGIEVTVILRGDRDLAWQLMPALGVYATADVSRMDTPASTRIVASEPLGAETVAGQATMKYRAEFQTRTGRRQQGFFWQNKAGVHVKSSFPVTDREGRARQVELELRDLRVGTQDPTLFEVPGDYRELDIDIGAVLGDLVGF